MTDDDGTPDPPEADPPAGIDRDDLKAAIREVLAEIPGLGDKAPELDPDDDDDDGKAVYSVREAEKIAERAVRNAMRTLAAAAPPKPPKPAPKVDKPGPEPPPEPPQSDTWGKVKKFLVS